MSHLTLEETSEKQTWRWRRSPGTSSRRPCTSLSEKAKSDNRQRVSVVHTQKSKRIKLQRLLWERRRPFSRGVEACTEDMNDDKLMLQKVSAHLEDNYMFFLFIFQKKKEYVPSSHWLSIKVGGESYVAGAGTSITSEGLSFEIFERLILTGFYLQPVLNAVVRDVRTFALILRAVAFTPVRT